MVRSPDGDTDMVTGVLRGDTLVPCFFILCLDYVLWASINIIKKIVSHLKKKKEGEQQADNILQKLPDADYVNDLVLLANTPAQADSLLHSLGQAIGGIGLYVNANKTVYIYIYIYIYIYKQDEPSLQ